MEKQKTYEEKIRDKRKYLIPFYGAIKAEDEGKIFPSIANFLCSTVLATLLLGNAINGIIYGTCNFKEIDAIVDQRIERKTNERKNLKHQLYLAIDADKNGVVDEQEFTHFYDWFEGNRMPTMNLKRIVESYKSEQK